MMTITMGSMTPKKAQDSGTNDEVQGKPLLVHREIAVEMDCSSGRRFG